MFRGIIIGESPRFDNRKGIGQMDGKDNHDKPVSRIIRERAMNILRDTRAKIDPALLHVMKEKLSPAAMGMVPPAAQLVAKPEPAPTPAKGADLKTSSAPETEPVDRQKIATIVLEYMKNRDDKNKH